MMRNTWTAFLLCLLLASLTGCANNQTPETPKSSNVVDPPITGPTTRSATDTTDDTGDSSAVIHGTGPGNTAPDSHTSTTPAAQE